MKMYYDADVDTDALNGKTIAVIGYGSQGRAQSRNMADSGADVIVGVRENGSSWNLVKEDGMTVKTIEDAAKEADIIREMPPIIIPTINVLKTYPPATSYDFIGVMIKSFFFP